MSELCESCVKIRCILTSFGDGPIPRQCCEFVAGPLVIWEERDTIVMASLWSPELHVSNAMRRIGCLTVTEECVA